MEIRVVADRRQMGAAAGHVAAGVLREAIAAPGRARLVSATGTSQFELLATLAADRSVDWSNVELFHLDEYLSLPEDHPASFRRFLRERLIEPAGIRITHLLDGNADPAVVMAEVGALLRGSPVDLACVGVGENGHLAFNEPPADFSATEPFAVVELDEVSREQQVGEGWFRSLADVPKRALTMTVPEILRASTILCLVPDARKAEAVRVCFGAGRVSPLAPASALLRHPRCTVYLDRASASLLEQFRDGTASDASVHEGRRTADA